MRLSSLADTDKIGHYIKFGGLIALPIVLESLPASFFDKGQSLCLSVLLLHKECFACGITRAIQHLIHLDFEVAWHFNKLVVFVFPILAFLWLKWTYSAWRIINSKDHPNAE